MSVWVGNDCRVYLYGSHEKVACDVVLSFDFAVCAKANYAVVDKHAQRVGRHGIAHIAQCGVAVGADAVEGVDRKVADVEFHVGVEREQSGNRERQLLWSKPRCACKVEPTLDFGLHRRVFYYFCSRA